MEDIGETPAAKDVDATTAPVATTRNVKRRKVHHHHHTENSRSSNSNSNSKNEIQKIEHELIKAKERVVELESILQPLKRKELVVDDGDESKQDNEEVDDKKMLNKNDEGGRNEEIDVDVDDAPSLFLQGQVLQSILEFLHPKEILTCVQVCRRWQTDIDTNQQIWRNAAQNISSPRFIRALEEKRNKWIIEIDDTEESETKNESNEISSSSPATKSEPTKHTISPPKDYKNVVLGLIRNDNTSTEDILCKKYVPKLQPKDVFAYVEIIDSQSGNVIGSLYENLIGMMGYPFSNPNGKQMVNVLKEGKILIPTKLDTREQFFGSGGLEYYSESYVPAYIHNSISFTLRLIRGDTGQCFHCGYLGVDFFEFPGTMTDRRSDRFRPEAKNEFGIAARDIWWTRKYVGMHSTIGYSTVPDHGEHAGYTWNNWRGTTYHLVGLNIILNLDRSPELDDDDYDYYYANKEDEEKAKMKDLMLSIEGLAWQ